MNKTAIKNYAVWARNKLIADIEYKAGLMGITENGIASALPQSTSEVQFFDIGTKDYASIRGREINQRNALVSAIRAKEKDGDYKKAFHFVVEKVAYTWFNRLVAIRFMEVNDYLPSRVRVLSSENENKAEPDMVTRPFDTDMSFSQQEVDLILKLKDENRLDELFRWLFIKQCHKLNDVLPQLFSPETLSSNQNDYMELLLTISFTDKDGVLWHLVHDIREQDFRMRTSEDDERQRIENIAEEDMPAGQVEIIGWMYQYYNTEPNALVYDGTLSKERIPKELLPAATTIYTPDWSIRYMVENSLGRLWLEGHPNNQLKKVWKYFLEEADQEAEVQKQLADTRKERSTIRPEDIKVIDPCMGSGHILVYLFDVLMQIYESQGWTQREAAQSIVQNNIYGLDIDERAAQLAYFAIMMKARQYDRRFLERTTEPHVYEIQESNDIDFNVIDYFADGNKKLKTDLTSIVCELRDAKEYGSILNITKADFPAIYARFQEVKEDSQIMALIAMDSLLPLVKRAEVMSQEYHIVVTNPPYLGASRFSPKLDKYVKENYADVKADLSMVMYKHAIDSMISLHGFVSFITTSSWLFLSSFEKLRNHSANTVTLTSIVDYGTELFDGKVGHNPITSWVVCKQLLRNYNLTAIRLVDYCYSRRDEKEPEFFESRNRFIAQQDNFAKIPGSPIAYWVSESFLKMYDLGATIGDKYKTITGSSTSDNNQFLRLWYEVGLDNVGYEINSQYTGTGYKWIKCNKGGSYRRWYGNNDYLINWENDGEALKAFCTIKNGGKHWSRFLKSLNLFYHPGITWSKVTSGDFSARYMGEGFIMESAACAIMPEKKDMMFILALMNSKITSAVLKAKNPTINMQTGDIVAIPVVDSFTGRDTVDKLSSENVSISKEDWDAFETSWDFQHHPLIRRTPRVADAFFQWEEECENRFQSLKHNEEEINRIFIDTYGLSDELIPEVDEKNVSIRKADLKRDIKSLISYAVGCMFGRYSLDKDGLVYAGGIWDESKYGVFTPDDDNCIPITDEAYFEDDIVGRFVDFIRVTFGDETLEENLDFIAKALGNKGNSSREIIRNYFLNEFFKDHCSAYSVSASGKRPIYWLFDSGKQNGFKALIYMHRWNADTIGNLRVEYLHRMQRVYEKEISRMQDIIDNGSDNKEINQAARRREKLLKQLKEAREYDAKIAHAALSRVEIDLDDGVKANYEKVQKGPDGKSLGILAKI